MTISSTSTTSQLQFRPVQQSDNGSYSCNATTNGLTLSTESVVINVNGIVTPHIHYYVVYDIILFYFQLPLCQSRSMTMELLKLLEKMTIG